MPLFPRLPVPASRLARVALAVAVAVAVVVSLGAPPRAGAAAPPKGFMGVTAWDEMQDADFARLGNANARVYRMDLLWKRVQPKGPSDWEWSYYDTKFRQAAQRGVRIVPVLLGSPSWVSSDPNFQPRTTEGKRAFRTFAAEAVKRYGPRGSLWSKRPWSPSAPASGSVQAYYWQVWNEPNWGANWYPKPSPTSYASFLKSASKAMKGASSSVRVMAAGLFWPGSWVSNATTPENFLAGMLPVSGLIDSVDIFALHPYDHFPFQVLNRVGSARGVLNRYGASSKRIWVTEFGWAGGATSWDGQFTVSNAQQAKNLDDTYKLMLDKSRTYRLMGGIWFSYKDHRRLPGEEDYWGYRSGLLDKYGRAKPSWNTFARRATYGW